MAIFAGDWKDADRVPFDPNAKVPHTWPGGGSAAVRRHRIRPHPMHSFFRATARRLRDRWHNKISEGNQAAWAAQGATGAPKRGTTDRTPVNGYIMYSAFDWAQLWYRPPSVVQETALIDENFLTAAINSVNLVDQEVTFTVTADPHLHWYPNFRLLTYQLHPHYPLVPNPWRATKLIHWATNQDFDPPSFQATAKLLWTVTHPAYVHLYWRGRGLSHWKFHATDSGP